MTILDDLFGHAAPAFLADIWASPHCHLATPSAGPRIQELARLPELAERANVIAHHRGSVKAIRSAGSAFRSKAIDRASAATHFAEGETIVFERISDHVPHVAAIRDDLASSLGFSPSLLYCNLYMTPPGGGVIKHFDDQDVWVVGVHGQKTFQVAPNRGALYPRVGDEVPDARAPMPADATTVVISPGSVLYMSPGLWHATSSETGAHTLSFGLRRPPWYELVEQQLSRELIRSVDWREPVSRVTPATPEVRARAAVQLARLREVVAQLDPRELIQGEARDPLRERVLRVTRQATIDERSTTIRIEQDEGVTELDCDESVHALARHIARVGEIRFASLHSELEWGELELVYALQGLVEAGVVETR